MMVFHLWIYTKHVLVLKDGKKIEINADERYLKNSILNPKEEVVDTYPNMMPAFKNILKDEEVDAVIDYLKDLKWLVLKIS